MGKNIREGAFGGGALKRIGKILHMGRLGINGSEKIHINPAQEKEINKMAKTVFGKDGKPHYEISGRVFEKEENYLAVKHVHGFNSKKADEVNKALGLTKGTKDVSYNYPYALRQERKAKLQEHFKALKANKKKEVEVKEVPEFKKERIIPESKKLSSEPGSHEWLEAIRSKYSKQNEEYGRSMLRTSESDNKFSGTPHNPYAKNDSELGGIKPNGREALNTKPVHEGSGRGIPHGSPSRDLSHEGGNLTPHTESIGPPAK